jgi:hypothetical protein
MAQSDRRIVAGALIGSLAEGPGDRWSDLDLGFGLAPGVTAADVLADWTPDLEQRFDAVYLFDLPFQSWLYRVFLFPGTLQVDLSFAPAGDFGARSPKFRLLFGAANNQPSVPLPTARYLFGMGVHHAVRGRFCLLRGKLWQAEYWISGVRDQALSLACLNRGLEPSNGRGYDQLPAEVRSSFEDALVRSLRPEELMRALAFALAGLLREAGEMRAVADRLTPQLGELLVVSANVDARTRG